MVMELNPPALRTDIVSADTQIALAQLGDEAESYSVQRNDGGEYCLLALEKVLYSGILLSRQVLIADSAKYGRLLVLDGGLQSASCDEGLYHELLVQPAMLLHPNPRRILVIGGADGACLRELIHHRNVEAITLLDCEPELVELAKEHLSAWHCGAFDDTRVKVVGVPAREFLQTDQSKYDVIIFDPIDLDLSSDSRQQYSKQFFMSAKARLAAGGFFAVQAMQLSPDCDKHFMIKRTLSSIFGQVHSYHAAIASFMADWSFILASDWFDPKKMAEKAIDDSAAARLRSSTLRHLDGQFLLSCFQFPKEVRARLVESGPLIEE